MEPMYSPSWTNSTIYSGEGSRPTEQPTPAYLNSMDLCRLSLLLRTAGIIVLIHMIAAATAYESQGSGPNWSWSLCGE